MVIHRGSTISHYSCSCFHHLSPSDQRPSTPQKPHCSYNRPLRSNGINVATEVASQRSKTMASRSALKHVLGVQLASHIFSSSESIAVEHERRGSITPCCSSRVRQGRAHLGGVESSVVENSSLLLELVVGTHISLSLLSLVHSRFSSPAWLSTSRCSSSVGSITGHILLFIEFGAFEGVSSGKVEHISLSIESIAG